MPKSLSLTSLIILSVKAYSSFIFNCLLLALSDVNISSKVTEESFLSILSIMSEGSVVGNKRKNIINKKCRYVRLPKYVCTLEEKACKELLCNCNT